MYRSLTRRGFHGRVCRLRNMVVPRSQKGIEMAGLHFRASRLIRIFVLVALVTSLLAINVPVASTQAGVQTIRTFNTTERVIVLTFDAGSDRGYAEQILNTLAQKNVKASFGMTGIWAQRNPDMIQRIVRDGHHLINHSWDHPSFTGFSTNTAPISSAQRTEQLVRTENLIRSQVGVELKPYFRPPYGDYDNSVLADLQRNGYLYNIMWSVDTLGWQGLTASQINQRVFNGATPGGIILMHVGAASQDAAALPAMIDGLRQRGYTFATVKQMVEGTVPPPAPTERHFPQTGFTVRGNFLQYWNAYGGLPVFGYPLSGEIKQGDATIQHFERARFEYRPGSWPARYDIQLGLLGRELTAHRTQEAPFRRITAQSDANCTYFPQTGHRLCHGFKGYWERFGGLAIYGYPISEEFREVNPDTGKTYVVQYFERQRFEWHPGEWPERYDVMLGRVGAQMMP
jgi:peptidoglycan/xylan/chitin deacetylase (PgdA/CDA1 family)